VKVLAISGGLRALSSNAAVLRAAGALAPPSIEFVLFEGIGSLPHFNPDLDGEDVPRAVTDLRMLVETIRQGLASRRQRGLV
jgi:chromate reductase, NAD(P)H dehydrogenase (quinone)